MVEDDEDDDGLVGSAMVLAVKESAAEEKTYIGQRERMCREFPSQTNQRILSFQKFSMDSISFHPFLSLSFHLIPGYFFINNFLI